MKISLLRLLGALLALHAAPAVAQESARALIERGVALREDGRDEEALALFVRANELETSGRALAQIGLAHQALGHWVDAERHLVQALEAQDRWIRQHRGALESALAVVREHLGSLELTGGINGANVLVNGEAAGTLPLAEPLRVPAGGAAVEVRADGYLPFQRMVQVPVGGTAREQIEMVRRADGHANRAAAEPGGSWTPGVLTWIGTPIAALGLVGFAILAPIFLSEHDAYYAMPTSEGADRAEALSISADVSLGVLALGGVLLIIGLLTGENSPNESAAALERGRLAIRF